MAALKPGDTVRQVAPVITGEIIDTEYDKDAQELRHLVRWKDASGDFHSRWFVEPEIEKVPE